MSEVRQALEDGANALQAMRRTSSARALRRLRDDLSFLERILVRFLRKNVDEELRAAAVVEDEIRGHTRTPHLGHGAQPGRPPRQRPGQRNNSRAASRNRSRSRSPLARRGNDSAEARPASVAEPKDTGTTDVADRSASDPLALEAEMPAELV